MKELSVIQQELKAPKGQFNSFSNFNYRSCEDILNAVKPLLKKQDAFLTLTDTMVQLGDRYYVHAVATIYTEKGNSLSVSAYAREALTKKGMDEAQITGAASSYARKYALNGLFCIDDTKDADSMDNKDNPTHKATTSPQKAIEEKPDIKETPEMNEKAVKIAEMFESSKDLAELEKHATSFRDEINTTMSKEFRAWLKSNYDSIKSKLKEK